MNDFFNAVIEKFEYDIISQLKKKGYAVDDKEQSGNKVTYYLSNSDGFDCMTLDQAYKLEETEAYKDFVEEQFEDFCSFNIKGYDEYIDKFYKDHDENDDYKSWIRGEWEKDNRGQLKKDMYLIKYLEINISLKNEKDIVFECDSHFEFIDSNEELLKNYVSREIPQTHTWQIGRIIAQALGLSGSFDDFSESNFDHFYSNHRIAKELIRIAKQLIAGYSKQDLKDNYNSQKIDVKVLEYLFQKYSDKVSIDLNSRLSQGNNTATIISLKKWLIDNGYEDWTNGKKYDALYNYNKKKLAEAGGEIIKDLGDVYLVSLDKLIKEADEEYNNNFSKRIIKGGYPNKEELKQLYIKYKENNNE